MLSEEAIQGDAFTRLNRKTAFVCVREEREVKVPFGVSRRLSRSASSMADLARGRLSHMTLSSSHMSTYSDLRRCQSILSMTSLAVPCRGRNSLLIPDSVALTVTLSDSSPGKIAQAFSSENSAVGDTDDSVRGQSNTTRTAVTAGEGKSGRGVSFATTGMAAPSAWAEPSSASVAPNTTTQGSSRGIDARGLVAGPPTRTSSGNATATIATSSSHVEECLVRQMGKDNQDVDVIDGEGPRLSEQLCNRGRLSLGTLAEVDTETTY